MAKISHYALDGHKRKRKACRVIDEDWDNLVILDACRYDLFEKVCQLEGELNYRYSLGSTSRQFIRENFVGETLFDTVYITANPYSFLIDKGTFYDMITLESEYDSELGTVHPHSVIKNSKNVIGKYPHKRFIIHIMQPHHPFLSGDGISIEEGGWDFEDGSNNNTVWTKLKKGELEKQAVWNAYRQNLEFVLDQVKELIEHLDGKTVITSDHGNMFGKPLQPVPKEIYAHPADVFTDELVKVPWFSVPFNCRRRIISGSPRDQEEVKESSVKDQLEALGYR